MDRSPLVRSQRTGVARPAGPHAGIRAATAYLANRSRGSRPTLEDALNHVARWLSGGSHDAFSYPWEEARYDHAVLLRAILAEAVDEGRFAISYANKILTAFRGVVKEAWRLDLIDTDSYLRAVDVRNLRGTSPQKGRALGMDELHALLDACAADPSPAGYRDGAAIALGYGAGLRVSELVSLDVRDWSAEGRVLIRAGKGRKAGNGHVTASAAARVGAWLSVRGPRPGPLFVPVNKAGRLLLTREVRRSPALVRRETHTDVFARLSPRGFAKVLEKRRTEAGLPALSPHDLRRSMITHLLDLTGDVALAQRKARHASPQTTVRYDRRQEAQDRERAGVLEEMFRREG